jgi:hypothetical protein
MELHLSYLTCQNGLYAKCTATLLIACIMIGQISEVATDEKGLGRWCGERLVNEINRVCTRPDGTVCTKLSGGARLKRHHCMFLFYETIFITITHL